MKDYEPSWQAEEGEFRRLFEPAPVPQPVSYPFWDYTDLAFVLLAAFVGMFLSFYLVSWVGRLVFAWGPKLKGSPLLLVQLLTYGIWFLALQTLLRVRYGQPFWRSMRWVAPQRAVWFSLFSGPVLAVWVGILGILLRTPHVNDPFQQFTADRWSITLLALFIVVLGPLCEELAFRGFMLPLLVRDCGPVLGVFLTALPFALLHGPQYQWQWQHLLLICMVGVAFSWARYRTGSTAASTVMHASYNLTLLSGYLSQLLRNHN